ncbi:MAG: hypothetical protein JRJ49_02280 [Deltaproteobacteria bacterium]|nr:hypothetical protein [Deltaproteobacteria bacterium]
MTCNKRNAHSHNDNSELSFEEKLVKLLKHWGVHNKEHNENYKKWSVEAKERGYADVSKLIEKAADMSLEINKYFEEAEGLMK